MQAMGNLRLIRGREKEASKLLLEVANRLTKIQEEIVQSSQIQNIDKIVAEQHLPSIDFRL